MQVEFSGYHPEHADRNLAAAVERAQEGTFGGGRGTGLRMVQRLNGPDYTRIMATRRYGQRPLACGWQPGRYFEYLSHAILTPESRNARPREHGRVVNPVGNTSQASVQISAHILDDEVGATREELSTATQRTRPYARACGQLVQSARAARGNHERVTRVDTLENCRHAYTLCNFSGQILERVHGQIDLLLEQCTIEFLREDAPIANL